MERSILDNYAWTLGTFDEESCRFFLREVGERLVPFFPFSVGIEEVYSLLLERYGRSQIADSLSVLHDLLEDDSNATGAGDDGDIWRSWRHSWRHRNDGLLRAAFPSVGNFVLPPPTSRFLRSMKAENFTTLTAQVLSYESGRFNSPTDDTTAPPLRNELNISLSSLVPTPSDQSTAAATKLETSSQHQSETAAGHDTITASPKQPSSSGSNNRKSVHRLSRRTIGSSTRQSDGDRDSQQGFTEIDLPPSLHDFDPSLSISFEMLTPMREAEKLSHTGQTLRTLQPIQEIRSTSSGRRSRDLANQPLSASGPGRVADSACSPEDKEYSDPPKESDKIAKQRTAHREARLIDGAIFPARSGKVQKKDRNLHDNVLGSSSARSSPVRLSWSGGRQNPQLRQSWLQGVRSLLHQNKQKLSDRLQHSTSNISHAGPSSIMSRIHRRVASGDTRTSSPRPIIQPSAGLDGAFDDNCSSIKHPHLNKPLPPEPKDQVESRSVSSYPMTTPSFCHSHDTTNRPSTASTTSTGITAISSRKAFEEVTKTLLNMDTPGSDSELPLTVSGIGRYEPAKSVPNSQRHRPQSPISFSSIAKGNPFQTTPVPLIPKQPAPLSFKNCADPHKTTSLLPHSRSESSLQPPVADYPPPRDYHLPELVKNLPTTRPDSAESNAKRTRGRSVRRSKSLREQDNDKNSVEAQQGNKKRSRSPMKKLFGFGKSESLKDIAGEPPSRPRHARKRSLQGSGGGSWTNKLRHGFLSSDTTASPKGNEDTRYMRHTRTPSETQRIQVSLSPPEQAKALSELELLMAFSANRFLRHESEAGRLSPVSLVQLQEAWTSLHRPPVKQFLYDQLTQRELVMANFKQVKVHGECASNPLALNSAMYNWKTMAKEMSVRTFCTPDSVIQKWLHDAHRILEMLGAPMRTFLTLQDMQVRTLSRMAKAQHQLLRTAQHSRDDSLGSEDLFNGCESQEEEDAKY